MKTSFVRTTGPLAVARGRRHHDAAAFARSDHSWSVQDHGRVADAESSEVVYLPSHLARRRGAVRARDRHADCGRSVSASHFAARDRPVDAVLPEGAADGFEGAGAALEAILSSPHFIFRLEREPETATPGTECGLPISISRRACRSSSGARPDKELIDVAAAGQVVGAGMLEKQTKRLLADARAEALGSRFAAQWLRLQDVDKVKPDPNFYPNFDDNLAEMMRHETELFFSHLVREDRSILDLYRADYTFLNERLARHYGIPGVAGSDFRGGSISGCAPARLLGQGTCSCRPRWPTAHHQCCAASG